MNDGTPGGPTAEAARKYVSWGFSPVLLHGVIDDSRCTCGKPMCERAQWGKHPVHGAWQKALITNADDAARIFASRAHANIGIATGSPSGFWALDIDPDNGGDVALAVLLAERGPLPKTRAHRTGSGGTHYLFRMPDDFEVTNRRGTLPNGIDVRGTGGQIVAPPSISGKGAYTVLDSAPIVDAPAWLLDMIRPRQRQRAGIPGEVLAQNVAGYAAGSRTEELAKRARELATLTGEGNGRSQRLNDLALYAGHGVPRYWSEEHAYMTAREASDLCGFTDAHGFAESERQIRNGLRAGMDDPWLGSSKPSIITWDEMGGMPSEYDPEHSPEANAIAAAAEREVREHRESKLGGQARMAQRFAERFSGELRNIHGLGWHHWSGSHWAEDDRSRQFEALYELTAEQLKLVDQLELRDETADIAKALRKQIVGATSTYSGMNGTTMLAGTIRPISTGVSEVDTHKELLATTRGTIDLASMTVRDSRQEDLLTKRMGTHPDPSMNGSLWISFIERILPDRDVREYVQRLLGCALWGEQVEQILPVFHGFGANGKGVLQRVMLRIFGTYGVALRADALVSKSGSQHASWMIPLRGARIAFASETDENQKFDAALVKRLTGGDPITANKMRQEDVTWDPTHQLILLTNHPPEADPNDEAMWRRLRVVPFDVVIPAAERDPYLAEKLERILPAIAHWVMEGWMDYRRRGGLDTPSAVVARTDAQRAEGDPVTRWMTEDLTRAHSAVTPSPIMYASWVAWCGRSGEQPGSVIAFGKKMEAKGIRRKMKTGYVFVGYAPTQPPDPFMSPPK